jgi:hypothetical protein
MEHKREWVRYNPLTATHETPDGTSVPAELVESACCLADVLRIASMRYEQRKALADKEKALRVRARP